MPCWNLCLSWGPAAWVAQTLCHQGHSGRALSSSLSRAWCRVPVSSCFPHIGLPLKARLCPGCGSLPLAGWHFAAAWQERRKRKPCAWLGQAGSRCTCPGKGGALLLGARWAQKHGGGAEGPESKPCPLGPQGATACEVLGSSRHLNWAVPDSSLGPGRRGEVTWPDPQWPALEGGPHHHGARLSCASLGPCCQCQGASPASLAKFPYAICQCVGAPCVSGRVFVEVDTFFYNSPSKGKGEFPPAPR